MVYCDSVSGFDFGKVSVPFRIQTLSITVYFNNEKFVQNLAFSMLETALSPESLPIMFDFSITFFILDPVPNTDPISEPECIQVPVSLRQKLLFRFHNTDFYQS